MERDDSNPPIDIPLLERTVTLLYRTGSKDERASAEHILQDLHYDRKVWLQVVHILSSTQNLYTRFFALEVLEGVIKYRWYALSVEHRDGIKDYISDAIAELSSDEQSFRRERLYVNKLNIILVQILKHEWPARWSKFIPDLVAAAKTSDTICENCMAILKLLSEEVFDFSRGKMTQQKIKELKESINSEFQLIHELCLYVLSAPRKSPERAELIRATLASLHAFLSWIPPLYIFESSLLETLLKLFPVADYRNLTLQCLTEVASLNFGDSYDRQYANMYVIFMSHLQAILPRSRSILNAYVNRGGEDQAFIQNVALFLTSFFKSHIGVLEIIQGVLELIQENTSPWVMGIECLINLSYVDDTEVFKVCLDYWNSLVLELVEGNPNMDAANMIDLQKPMLPGISDGQGSQLVKRRTLYSGTMSKLRQLMICRMAKPEEFLILEDENGNIDRETMKDNDVLVQYKIMRETLIYLSHLDCVDTEKQMLRKLSKLTDDDWSWNDLKTLCWSIGSISGSMLEDQENRILEKLIQALQNLSRIIKGKDNQAVIAINLMYVVGQYPRFLRARWKDLKVVVNMLFEFMHKTHPGGVRDMALDTFLKIVQKGQWKFVIVKVEEREAFISELLTRLGTIIVDLEPHQIRTFYEAVGQMIQAESNPLNREEYLQKLMHVPNQKWDVILGKAFKSAEILKDKDIVKEVLNILQTNTSVASSLGQITRIFRDMLHVFKMCSELISTSIGEGGQFASRTSLVKLLRSVKRETLELVEIFLDKTDDRPQSRKRFVPPMMDLVLDDYARNVPDARESEVLSLFAIINKYKGAMIDDVPRIFVVVFECTLEMITKNFEDHPEHRLRFFSLLRAIATNCFPSLIRLSSESPQQLKIVMDSIIWAFSHTEHNIAETGLKLLLEILKNFQVSEFRDQFYRTYFGTIEREIFLVLTDTFHKPGFKLHVLVLQHLFCLVESGLLTEPLWDVSAVSDLYSDNKMFVQEYTVKLLITSFPNMEGREVAQFVVGLFQSTNDLSTFKNHIRDFLVYSKEISARVTRFLNLPFYIIVKIMMLLGDSRRIAMLGLTCKYINTCAEKCKAFIFVMEEHHRLTDTLIDQHFLRLPNNVRQLRIEAIGYSRIGAVRDDNPCMRGEFTLNFAQRGGNIRKLVLRGLYTVKDDYLRNMCFLRRLEYLEIRSCSWSPIRILNTVGKDFRELKTLILEGWYDLSPGLSELTMEAAMGICNLDLLTRVELPGVTIDQCVSDYMDLTMTRVKPNSWVSNGWASGRRKTTT